MRTRPERFPESAMVELLRGRWGIAVQSLEYAPVGFGSYHWIVIDTGGSRWFVTADKLDAIGVQDASSVEANFDGLRAAYDTATALRDSGLKFVVAPLPTMGGETIVRLSEDWAMGLFPFLEGRPAGDGSWQDGRLWGAAAELTGRLHHMLPPPSLRRWQCAIPYRARLHEGLASPDAPWDTGPYGEQARRLLLDSQAVLASAFARYDDLCDALSRLEVPWVVTHGEPHSANFVETNDDKLMLIDWDTVRLAPPERDLWILLERGDGVLEAYRNSAGAYAPRPEVVQLFRCQWVLADVCIYARRFSSPHGDDADDRGSYEELELWLLDRLPRMP